MEVEIYVASEFEALHLLFGKYGTDMSAHEAGNKIIELAERIKAERAVAAMQTRRAFAIRPVEAVLEAE